MKTIITPSTQDIVDLEWARLSESLVAVATPDEAWLHELAGDDDPFAEPMTGPGSLATTRQLLEAAWCAARAEAAPALAPTERTVTSYVWELVGSHYLTRNTPILLREVAERFARVGRSDLEKFALKFARLESGDEQMAIDDLAALGFDAHALVHQTPPPQYAVRGAEFFASAARGSEPLDTFGYAFAVERSSLSLTREDLEAYEAFLPPGVDALSCRRHHSGVGGDVAHVKFCIHRIAQLPAADRAHIARATYDAQRFLQVMPQIEETDFGHLEKRFSQYRVRAEASLLSA